jgi:hypothetical protein
MQLCELVLRGAVAGFRNIGSCRTVQRPVCLANPLVGPVPRYRLRPRRGGGGHEPRLGCRIQHQLDHRLAGARVVLDPGGVTRSYGGNALINQITLAEDAELTLGGLTGQTVTFLVVGASYGRGTEQAQLIASTGSPPSWFATAVPTGIVSVAEEGVRETVPEVGYMSPSLPDWARFAFLVVGRAIARTSVIVRGV